MAKRYGEFEGKMLEQLKKSMFIITLYLLNVLLINLFVHGIALVDIVYVPPIIHSCTTLSFLVQIENHSNLETLCYDAFAF